MVENVPHSFSAFRGCDAHSHEHGISYAAVMEWDGPDAVERILRAADDAGMWCALLDEDDTHQHCYATLDLRDADGDIVGDRCITTRAAFDWWVRAVELRVDMSDCPVDTPEAHAATYAWVEAVDDGRIGDAAGILLANVHGGAR